ncbi:hypothetical protein D3C85_968980 [compost metagenome]
MHVDEFGAQIHHVIAQDPLDPTFQAVFQPDHRELLHALVQRQRQRTTAHRTAFVFQYELLDAPGAFFQYVYGQAVFEVDIRGLARGALAETGAAMVGMTFKVHAVAQLRKHLGFAGAGHPAQQDEIALGHGLIEGVQQEGAHGLVATAHPWIVDAGLVLEPLLDNLRAQAAAKAIQQAIRMRPGKIGPGLDAFGLDRARHQLMPQHDGRLLAVLLVAGADPLAFMVIHQRQVDHAGKRTLVEFDRRAGVHHWPVVEEDVAVISAVDEHQNTSTALLCRSTSSPIGSRLRPSSAATERNCSLP